ncbi:MAG TPA: methyl-accepting chemotaxis protein [Myxococcota bacterium]|nr:methyl-accepting chemotaxis protein [Myxococcota bacterium]
MKLQNKIIVAILLAVAAPFVVLVLLPDSISPRAVKLTVGFVALGCALLAGLFTRAHGRRLGRLVEAASGIGAGDLSHDRSQHLLTRRRLLPDEIDALSASLSLVREAFLHILQTVEETTGQAERSSSSLTDLAKRINVSAGNISRSMEEISRGAELQTELVEKTSTLVGEMARSIQRTSLSAEDAARSSRDASQVAQSGSKMAGEAVEKMRGVFEGVEKYSRRVYEFGEKTREIGNIVRVITDVAQQTHLLAINATIEAARAGEAGRGFAVVAEEIRQLADNSSRSAERIGKIVEEVTAESEDAMQAVKESALRLSEGRDQLSYIIDSLKNIVATVTSGSDRVQIISRLAKEQIAGAEQTVKAIQNILRVTQKNASSTDSVSRAVEAQSDSLLDMTKLAAEIVTLAGVLDAEVRKFKFGESDER